MLPQRLDDITIAPVRRPAAVATMVDAASASACGWRWAGVRHARDRPGRAPLKLEGRVEPITDGQFVVTGPMYTGVRMHLGRTAVLAVENEGTRAQIVVTERRSSRSTSAYSRTRASTRASVT